MKRFHQFLTEATKTTVVATIKAIEHGYRMTTPWSGLIGWDNNEMFQYSHAHKVTGQEANNWPDDTDYVEYVSMRDKSRVFRIQNIRHPNQFTHPIDSLWWFKTSKGWERLRVINWAYQSTTPLIVVEVDAGQRKGMEMRLHSGELRKDKK